MHTHAKKWRRRHNLVTGITPSAAAMKEKISHRGGAAAMEAAVHGGVRRGGNGVARRRGRGGGVARRRGHGGGVARRRRAAAA